MKTLFAVIVMTFSLPNQASACSCLEPKVGDVLKWADVVFAGKVVKVQYVDDLGDKMFGERRIIVMFQVFAYWKGNVGQTITLHTVYNRSSCNGYSFRQGEDFIVYAKKDKAMGWLEGGDRRATLNKGAAEMPGPDDLILETGLCTRTNHLTGATEDLKKLGSPKVPK